MVQTAQYDPLVVEPALTPQKIMELLTRANESAKLDYKAAYDPSDLVHRIKFVKHVLAMANTAGGYLVVGVENNGQRRGLTEEMIERLDEAVLRSQVSGYNATPIPIFLEKFVVYEGQRFAIVTVLPVVETIVVASSDGNCKGGPLFHKGDVLVRHGSASERWNQNDAEFLLQRVLNTRKEAWLRELGSDLTHLFRIARPNQAPEVDEKVYDLSTEDFQKLAIELMRR